MLSVDAVKMYKPRPEVYALVTEQFTVAPAEVVFVSSNRWDAMGATAFGFRTVWVNRGKAPDEYPDWPPAAVVSGSDRAAVASFRACSLSYFGKSPLQEPGDRQSSHQKPHFEQPPSASARLRRQVMMVSRLITRHPFDGLILEDAKTVDEPFRPGPCSLDAGGTRTTHSGAIGEDCMSRIVWPPLRPPWRCRRLLQQAPQK